MTEAKPIEANKVETITIPKSEYDRLKADLELAQRTVRVLKRQKKNLKNQVKRGISDTDIAIKLYAAKQSNSARPSIL